MGNDKLSQRGKSIPEKSPRPFPYKMSEEKPEVVYAGCVTLSHLYSPIPIDLNNTLYQPVFTMPSQALRGITVGWNYSDALDAFIAAYELLKKDTYHKKRNKVKAALNILSGTQLLIFSDNYGLTNFGSAALAGATALASPAFAFAMLCDLINLSIDLFYAARKTEFEGWLEEKLLKLRYLEEQNNHQKVDELNNLIALRCRVYSHEDENRKNAIKTIFERHRFNIPPQLFEIPSDDDKFQNSRIQNKLDDKFYKSLKDWTVKFISFSGMTLLAVSSFVACPPLVIIGTVLVTAVSIYYVQKHFRKLIPETKPDEKQVSVAEQGIFKTQPQKSQTFCFRNLKTLRV